MKQKRLRKKHVRFVNSVEAYMCRCVCRCGCDDPWLPTASVHRSTNNSLGQGIAGPGNGWGPVA